MTYNYPFFSFPHFRRYPNYYHAQYPYGQSPHYKGPMQNKPNNIEKQPQPKEHKKEEPTQKTRPAGFGFLNNIFHQEDRGEDEDFFELLGLKLYNDDILLLGLIFFLYKEDVKDQYLFFALILLLLS